MNIANKIEKEILEVITKSIKKSVHKKKLKPIIINNIKINKTNKEQYGDFFTNIAIIISKNQNIEAIKIASLLIEYMDIKNTYIEYVKKNSAFINFYIKKEWLYENLSYAIYSNENYGNSNYFKGKTINVTSILNLKNKHSIDEARVVLKSNILVNILKKTGYRVKQEPFNKNGNQRYDRQVIFISKSNKESLKKLDQNNKLYTLKVVQPIKLLNNTNHISLLEDLKKEINNNTINFLFNLKESSNYLEIDFNNVKKQTNKNIAFYIQYTYFRLQSLLKILEKEGITTKKDIIIDYTLLKQKEELQLLKKISEYQNELINTIKTLELYKISKYCEDLVNLFHNFYKKCNIRGIDKDLLYGRMALIKGTSVVIKNILTILNISVHVQM